MVYVVVVSGRVAVGVRVFMMVAGFVSVVEMIGAVDYSLLRVMLCNGYRCTAGVASGGR